MSAGVSFVFAFVLRSILSAPSPSAIVDRLSALPVYAGYSLNVMSACSGDTGPSLTNIEGYGDRVAVQTRGRETRGSQGVWVWM